MDELEKKEMYNQLFDCYRDLLTDKQRLYFERYYVLDYSLGEIADEFNLSRNAIFDNIKKTIKIMEKYEMVLHLIANNKKRNEIISKLEEKYNDDLLTDLKNID